MKWKTAPDRMVPVLRTALVGLLAIPMCLSACGGGDDDAREVASLGTNVDDAPTAAEPVDPETARVNYSNCLQEEGLTKDEIEEAVGPVTDSTNPDQAVGGNQAAPEGEFETVDGEQNEEDAQRIGQAVAACEPVLQQGREEVARDPDQQAELADLQLEYNRCLKEQGAPDMYLEGGVGPDDEGESESDQEAPGPDFDIEAAVAICDQQVAQPDALRDRPNQDDSDG